MYNRVKELRESLGMSKKDFATKLDVSANTITNIESNKNQLGITVAFLIAETFTVSLDWLYGLSNEKNIAGMGKFESFFNFKKLLVPIEDKNTLLTKEFTVIQLSNTLIEYYNEISEIEKINKEKDLPEAAYIAWKESVIKKHELKLKEDKTFTEYVLIKNDEDFINDLLFANARHFLSDESSKKELDRINYNN